MTVIVLIRKLVFSVLDSMGSCVNGSNLMFKVQEPLNWDFVVIDA